MLAGDEDLDQTPQMRSSSIAYCIKTPFHVVAHKFALVKNSTQRILLLLLHEISPCVFTLSTFKTGCDT